MVFRGAPLPCVCVCVRVRVRVCGEGMAEGLTDLQLRSERGLVAVARRDERGRERV